MVVYNGLSFFIRCSKVPRALVGKANRALAPAASEPLSLEARAMRAETAKRAAWKKTNKPEPARGGGAKRRERVENIEKKRFEHTCHVHSFFLWEA